MRALQWLLKSVLASRRQTENQRWPELGLDAIKSWRMEKLTAFLELESTVRGG